MIDKMKVYLFEDYLKAIRGEAMQESQSICEINTIKSFPGGLVRIKGKLARLCMLSEDGVYIEFMGKIPKNEDISNAINITCPHCGSEERDSWEASDSDDNYCCAVCESVFSYERNVEVTYSSSIIERNESVLSLK